MNDAKANAVSLVEISTAKESGCYEDAMSPAACCVKRLFDVVGSALGMIVFSPAFLAIYAAIKKSLTIDSIVSTTSEILMMVPVALLFILFFRMGDNGMGSMTVVKQLLMIGGGVITGLPMVFYSIGVRHLPLMTTGICQYISPSLSIICGAIMGEALTREKLVSFLFIWTGVILYVLNTVYEEKQKKKAAVQ